MGKPGKQGRKRSRKLPPRDPVGRVARQEPASHGKDEHAGRGPRSWADAKRPILRFVLIFGGLMALFYAVFYLPLSKGSIVTRFANWHVHAYAQASGTVLGVLGHDVRVIGGSISSPRFSVRIIRGCDGMEVTAMFICAVVAAPVSIRRKLVGAAGGVAALALINVVRIVSLFYVGIHFPRAFDTMHFGVWQAVVVVLAILLWVVWAWWATRRTAVPSDVSA